MTRDEFKRLSANKPTLRATLAELEADLLPKQKEVDALSKRRNEILASLSAIDDARAELSAPAPTTPSIAQKRGVTRHGKP